MPFFEGKPSADQTVVTGKRAAFPFVMSLMKRICLIFPCCVIDALPPLARGKVIRQVKHCMCRSMTTCTTLS